jgi:hypothetical protein
MDAAGNLLQAKHRLTEKTEMLTAHIIQEIILQFQAQPVFVPWLKLRL